MLLPMRSPRRPLRVLHTADIHLDSDGYGSAAEQAAHRERDRGIFRRIVDRVLADRIDLLLIAGDLFDHNRVPDETVAFVRSELDRLRQPVVILPGNHDCLYPSSIYDRHDFTAGAEHVHVIGKFDGETVDLPELDALVWGRAMAEHEPGFSPLAHVPGRDDRRWCLAMGHGFFFEERQRPDRSSPIFADEIRDTGWDYVALGHYHVHMDVSQGPVVAHYAGAPAADASRAAVLYVELSIEGGVRVEPRSLTPA
ncbi:MAG: metallophosphoesterase family protein [Longimicrobiales bacterium]